MADNFKIGAGLALDGEAEFKKAVSGINKDLSVLGSEMKKVTAQFSDNANSMEALTAKQKVYNERADEQRRKIETMTAALENAKKEYGENSDQVKNWQIKLNNAEADLAKTESALKANESALNDTARGLNDAGDAAEKSGNKFEKMGGVLKASAVAMGAVVVAAGAAAVQLGKAVITAYADYEQLVGGVDTLFKDSSGKLQDYAANAYKTAGLSANEYMETVTSFSASLVSSLGGDTEKAVKYADMAITDMSDNANKMGTDMASIQTAYQGFAKQNYTMLDNLKLGYGGTKSEMERLLKDASAISGIKYDVSSYADVVEAIHVMQESMDIAGTTALEAEETISGSLNSMKSAWGNLIIGLGRSDADLTKLVENVVDGFSTVVKNVVPIIENLVKALPTAFKGILPAIGNLLPPLLDTVTSLFQEVLTTVLALLPELIPAVVAAVVMIADTLIENLPLIIDGAFQLIMALANGIMEALPELTPKIVAVMVQIVKTIVENLPQMAAAALKIIVALAAGLITSIPELIKAVPELVVAIKDAFVSHLENIKDIGKNIVKGIWQGITSMTNWLASKVKGFVDSIVSAFTGKDGIDAHSPSRLFAKFGGYMAQGIGVGFEKEMSAVTRQINSSIPTDVTMTGQYQANAIMGENIVNGLAGVLGGQANGGTYNINVMLPDGTVLARAIFDPLKDVSKQKGVALA